MIHRSYNENDSSPNLAISILIIAAFTRELYLVYLPVFCIRALFLLKKKYNFNHKSIIPISFFLFLYTMNIPSLLKSGTLSYDKKFPPTSIRTSWSQLQYLAQLKVNKGELENMEHPSWEETQDYINVNGANSLPEGGIKGMDPDFKFTISEFLKDFWYTVIFHASSIGMMLIIPMLYWGWETLQTKKFSLENHFIPIITLIMIIIFSLTIISFIELRWLPSVFIMCVVYYNFLEKRIKIPNLFIKSNLIFSCIHDV